MSQPSIRLIYRIVTLLALGAFLLAPVGARPALADVAAPTILDNVEEWAVGAGLVYWAQTCFADEFNPIATLKRIPAGGGVQRTLESINNDASCRTYQALHSSGDGLYYFDDDENRIERMPLGEPYTPTGIANLSDIQAPSLRPALIEGGDFLYWLSPFGAIYRTAKAGGGPIETVATTGTQPNDLLLVGNTMYWSDSTGIWSISVNCESLPCNSSRTQFSNIEARAHGLLYQSLGGFNGAYRIYWVEAAQNGANITWSIRYQACNAITVCFVLPPPGQLSPPPPLLYTATTNWQIGDLALAAGNLYWTEADRSTINNSNGDVKRKPYNDANPGAQTIATGQANLDSRIFIAGASMFFARRNNGIYSLPLNASAIVRDFEVAGIEATQAIQNLANNAPLVAEKTTYVRGYARQVAGPSAPNVEARLVGLRNGNPLPGSPLQPVNGVRALSTGGSFDRSRLNDGWYFLLPASWISAGTIELRLEIDARQVHSDPNRSNNQISQNITFQEAPPICVWTVPVRTHTPLPSVYDPNFSTMIDHFKRRWPTPDVWVFRDVEPVEELELCSYYGLPYPCHGPYELSDGWGFGGLPDRDKVIVSLWTRALLSFNPDSCDDIGAPVHFMGMVHPAADNGGFAGYASTVSNQSWVQLPAHTPNPIAPGWNQIREGSVMAQELAHNYGRKHVDCGDPDDIDGNYPYPPCQIANVGAASYYGFDVTTLQPIRPNETADFMSYARRSWVSDYTWRGLLSSVQAASVSAKPQLLAQPGQAPGIFVSGVVDMENERGALSTILQLPGASLPPATVQLLSDQRAELDHGNTQHTYSLRLLGPNDAVLLERTLVVRPLDDHSAESANAVFSDLFAPPAGSVTTIQLLADGVVIDSLKPGAAAPQVTIQQPGAGVTISNTLTLRWTASDPDQADRLRYTVQYSHDAGASWHTVGLDLPGGPDPQVSLNLDDLGSLPGSAPNGARIRVLASDGYNTTIATSAAFTLADRLPEPAISAPYAGQSLRRARRLCCAARPSIPKMAG
ncbi:MAG: fibronectin type III domain-containing protein [Oscillochloris sp.]|nr:fibronectin type III domain-containing protein [Oscillochloris sp.]